MIFGVIPYLARQLSVLLDRQPTKGSTRGR
jgi:hypothetical protein